MEIADKMSGTKYETLFQDRDVIDKKEKTIWELQKHKDAAMQERMASINENLRPLKETFHEELELLRSD